MPGKNDAPRQDTRTVQLTVNGLPVELNGFVMDVFQETIVGLVKALGTEKPEGTITVTIGPDESS
jgi:hypothetical protein